MNEEKNISPSVEKQLMSLAHEILRARNKLSLTDIHNKAAAIAALTNAQEPKAGTETSSENETSSTLEDALQQKAPEVVFETIPSDFAEVLFEGNTTDYKRVMSMLNSKETAEEAKKFVQENIQPDYDWSEKQHEVEAFMAHITQLYVA